MPTPPLTSKQRAHLRGLAHALKPILHIGKEGITESAVAALREALNTRELIKLRVLEAAPESARDTASTLAGRISEAQIVQVMGRNAVLYRPDPDTPTIRLPR